jgi:ATP-dependent DNA helicase RecG
MSSSRESQNLDRKSIRMVSGSTADFGELARDCVCFANGAGGTLLIGIEDDAEAPPAHQRVDPALADRIRKRVGELTVNVHVAAEVKRHRNGGEYVAVTIPRSVGVASTSDGRYFLRVGDTCRPIVGDEVMRLADERAATPWEQMISLGVARAHADAAKVARLCAGLRASDRVKPSVKEKNDDELLTHYGLAEGDVLTNLGVLLVGGARDRARLGSAPIVHAIKYDDRDSKVAKWSWDDHELSSRRPRVCWEPSSPRRSSYRTLPSCGLGSGGCSRGGSSTSRAERTPRATSCRRCCCARRGSTR